MEQVVYVDVLVITNLIINYFLLHTVSKIMRLKTKRPRLILGAAAGAAYSLVIFLPMLSFTYSSAMKLILSVVIVLITFGFMRERRFFLTIFVFYAVNFAFAGIMFTLWLFFAPPGLMLNNGVVYFDISPLMLILLSTFAYMIIRLFSMLFSHRSPKNLEYDLFIFAENRGVTMKALMDTGNSLMDIFTETPVIIVNIEYIKKIIPESLKSTFKAMLNNDTVSHDFTVDEWGKRFRVIPFSTVSGQGLLPAFKPDKIIISQSDKSYTLNDIYVAACNDSLANGQYGALINPEVLKYKEKSGGAVIEKVI